MHLSHEKHPTMYTYLLQREDSLRLPDILIVLSACRTLRPLVNISQ